MPLISGSVWLPSLVSAFNLTLKFGLFTAKLTVYFRGHSSLYLPIGSINYSDSGDMPWSPLKSSHPSEYSPNDNELYILSLGIWTFSQNLWTTEEVEIEKRSDFYFKITLVTVARSYTHTYTHTHTGLEVSTQIIPVGWDLSSGSKEDRKQWV